MVVIMYGSKTHTSMFKWDFFTPCLSWLVFCCEYNVLLQGLALKIIASTGYSVSSLCILTLCLEKHDTLIFKYITKMEASCINSQQILSWNVDVQVQYTIKRERKISADI